MTVHWVVIGRDCRRVIAYAQDGVYVMFRGDKHDALPQIVRNSGCYRILMGWLASLTREDEARPSLGLPRVVESKGMFFRMIYRDYLQRRMVIFSIGDRLWFPSLQYWRSFGNSIVLVLWCIQVARRCIMIFVASITGAG